MQNLKLTSLSVACAALLTLGGCATNSMTGTGTPQASAQGYTVSGAQSVQSVQLGTVLAVHPVVIAAQGSGLGAIGGALTGGAVGHQIGNGTGQTLASIAGALAGLVGGQALEGSASKESGLLVTVKLDDGRVLAITQASDVQLAVGERVQVLSGRDGKARVLPL
uniref:17 kDa surface antigen n=1 Tax=Thiomonas intermedia (strain K12) TaxID=75379 RepID=D5X4J6_THIK1